jgi:uncharacterized protein YdeI (YjbR/CyaY-like superfamily)
MAAVVPNPKHIRSFRTRAAFEAWLEAHHASEPEVWIKIYKKNSGTPSVTPAQAVDVCLCWGWIDGIRKGLDEVAFLQRYCPRKTRSLWSQINRENVARLIAEGRMTEHGMRHVDAAKADGRWDAAYAPMRNMTEASMPDDLRAAIEANPQALVTFRGLGRPNLFALAFRVNAMKTAAGRVRKITTLVEMLARGETIVPEKKRDKPE